MPAKSSIASNIFDARDQQTYYNDPVAFVHDYLIYPAKEQGASAILSRQIEDLLNALAKHSRVAAESGHGCGKSNGIPFAAIWFLFTRHDPRLSLTKVRMIANTEKQVKDVLWTNMKLWLRLSPLQALVDIQETVIAIPVEGKNDNTYATYFLPNSVDSLQGGHAPHLLWLADEAFNIDNPTAWANIEGSLTEGEDNRILFVGQHTTTSGFCHDAFHRNREMWHHMRFSSLDSPFVNRKFVDSIANSYGVDSNMYRVRVLGMEPGAGDRAFLGMGDVMSAVDRQGVDGGGIYLGVDCARFGDDLTSITGRYGMQVYSPRTMGKSDSFQIEGAVLEEVRRIRAATGDNGIAEIRVDATGGWGAGAIDLLNKNKADNIRVIPITISSGNGNAECYDITTVMWNDLKKMLPHLSLPNDPDLTDELVSREYGFNRGKLQIETKEQYKARLKKNSPDRSDSLVLCVTGASSAKTVFEDYIQTDPECHREFHIPWETINPHRFSVYVMAGFYANTMYLTFWLWDGKQHVLRGYDEAVIPRPTAEDVMKSIEEKAKVPVGNANVPLSVVEIYANKTPFGDGRSMASYLRKEGVRIRDTFNANTNGSIMAANKMFRDGAIVVHERCQEINRQFSQWSMSSSGTPASGFPICENLLAITSVLRHKEEQAPKVVKPKTYSQRNISNKDAVHALSPKAKKVSEYDFII